MKIIEGLKRLKVIEKRIAGNTQKIEEYASILSTEKPAFESEEAQAREVSALVQSSEDLFTEYLQLKRRLERTNTEVTVELDGREFTLSDLLVIKRRMARQMMNVYQALNTGNADRRMSMARHASGDNKVEVIRLYKEEDKNENLRKWQDRYDNIESRLEVINATTDLVD